MTLYVAFDQHEFNRYDFGQQINFKLYGADGETAFDATGWDTVVVKCFKRHSDRAFFFRDVAKALTVIGQMAQIISDITGSWDTQNAGQGHFSFSSTLRPTIPGYLWLVVQLQKSGGQLSSKPVRVYVHPSEAQ